VKDKKSQQIRKEISSSEGQEESTEKVRGICEGQREAAVQDRKRQHFRKKEAAVKERKRKDGKD